MQEKRAWGHCEQVWKKSVADDQTSPEAWLHLARVCDGLLSSCSHKLRCYMTLTVYVTSETRRGISRICKQSIPTILSVQQEMQKSCLAVIASPGYQLTWCHWVAYNSGVASEPLTDMMCLHDCCCNRPNRAD